MRRNCNAYGPQHACEAAIFLVADLHRLIQAGIAEISSGGAVEIHPFDRKLSGRGDAARGGADRHGKHIDDGKWLRHHQQFFLFADRIPG